MRGVAEEVWGGDEDGFLVRVGMEAHAIFVHNDLVEGDLDVSFRVIQQAEGRDDAEG
jgi:hypothetical protein